ncbi:hypothetical protein [Bacteroides nordii]|uniref:hypothetical protein n=1 Tax=Bacteroides nordii TaxID=291645 RepID=UPI0021E64141|nr:hypothetical protein [Bacteroides nordii]
MNTIRTNTVGSLKSVNIVQTNIHGNNYVIVVQDGMSIEEVIELLEKTQRRGRSGNSSRNANTNADDHKDENKRRCKI